MAKKTVKALVFVKEEGAFGLVEYELDEDILKKHGKVLDKSNPDIFAIFVNQLTKKSREIFGI